MTYGPEDDDSRGFPNAPKGNGGDPIYDPLSGETYDLPRFGPQSPFSEPMSGFTEQPSDRFPLSSPYSGPLFPGDPSAPPPPTKPRNSGDDNRRSRRAVIAGALLVALLASSIGIFVTLQPHGDSSTTPPVAVATDTPFPTPTLLPGQTPLPTAIPSTPIPPTATPKPGAPPPPTATPIPYASSGVVSFTRVSKGANLPGNTLTAATSGGSIVATQISSTKTATVTVNASHFNGTFGDLTLTVTNNQSFADTSSGVQIVSVAGFTCALQGSTSLIPPGGNTTQICRTQPKSFPATDWNDTTSNPGFAYTGHTEAGGADPYYFVPQNCTIDDASTAGVVKTAVQNALNSALSIPGGSSVFYDSGVSYGAITCNPGYQYQRPATFTIDVSIAASTQTKTYYSTAAAINYQKGLVTADNGWQVVASAGCGSPSNSGATATSVTITCPATGTQAWNAFNTQGMASLIAGKDQATAKGVLDAVQGIVPGSESFSLTGGSYLPTNSTKITFSWTP